MKNEEGKANCCLLFGKSRVTLFKFISVPQLKLNAVVLLVKLSQKLKQEIEVDGEFYWTNIEVVLNNINNESKQLNTNVANRVQMIRNNTMYQNNIRLMFQTVFK